MKKYYPKAVTYEAVSISGDKVGIFGKHQKPIFDSLKKVGHSFYETTKDGKKFWLDKRSFKLYER